MTDAEFEEMKAHNKRLILEAFEIPDELARAWDEAHNEGAPAARPDPGSSQ